MNPRVSRSSALASKATGFPDREDRRQARARLSPRRDPERHHAPHAGVLRADHRLRRRQDSALELREVPAGRSHADDADEVGRRGDGDRPHLQGSVHEGRALARARAQRPAVRATPSSDGRRGRRGAAEAAGDSDRSPDVGSVPRARPRLDASSSSTRSRRSIRGSCGSSPRSPRCGESAAARGPRRARRRRDAAAEARRLRRPGARAGGRRRRKRRSASGASAQGSKPVYKRVDTCAAEFESFTPYLYSSYEPTCEANPNGRHKVVILGSGPNRIGQGIEFDYCCCHAAFALREEGLETMMINCNPETVSTDYDTADRLYFQPLTFEDVMAVIETERSAGGDVSCLVQFGGQTPLKLALALQEAGVRILGTSPDSIDLAEDRKRFAALLVGAGDHAAGERHGDVARGSARRRRADRIPGRRAAVVRARRPRHGDRLRRRHARSLHDARRRRVARASGPRRQVPRGRVRVRRRRHRRRDRRRRHRRHHGAHRGGRHPLRRQLVRRAAVHLSRAAPARRFATTRAASRAR